MTSPSSPGTKTRQRGDGPWGSSIRGEQGAASSPPAVPAAAAAVPVVPVVLASVASRVPPLHAASTLEKNTPMVRVSRRAAIFDKNGDGLAHLLLLDSTGDGRPDQLVSFVAVDTTGDGRADCLIADFSGDGRIDYVVFINFAFPMAVPCVLVGNGQANLIYCDSTGAGVPNACMCIYSYQHGPQQQSSPGGDLGGGHHGGGLGGGGGEGGGGSEGGGSGAQVFASKTSMGASSSIDPGGGG